MRGRIAIVGVCALFICACAQKSGFERWRESRIGVYMNDFGELSRYAAANSLLAPPRVNDRRVVFIGDSITDGWDIARTFPDKPYVNRGISGQTTPQMLVRFHADVVALQPAIVVLLAGTNDIAGNTGPMTIDQIEANVISMAEIAAANRIRMVVASVLPVHDYTPQARDYFSQRQPASILEINRRLRAYCARTECVYLDYFSAMVDDRGLLKRELADDGLHPNAAGYAVMVPLVEAAIAQALATR